MGFSLLCCPGLQGCLGVLSTMPPAYVLILNTDLPYYASIQCSASLPGLTVILQFLWAITPYLGGSFRVSQLTVSMACTIAGWLSAPPPESQAGLRGRRLGPRRRLANAGDSEGPRQLV